MSKPEQKRILVPVSRVVEAFFEQRFSAGLETKHAVRLDRGRDDSGAARSPRDSRYWRLLVIVCESWAHKGTHARRITAGGKAPRPVTFDRAPDESRMNVSNHKNSATAGANTLPISSRLHHGMSLAGVNISGDMFTVSPRLSRTAEGYVIGAAVANARTPSRKGNRTRFKYFSVVSNIQIVLKADKIVFG